MNIQDQLKVLREDISEIKACLIGTLGARGFVARVEELEQEHKKTSGRVAAIMLVFPLLIAAVGAVITLR